MTGAAWPLDSNVRFDWLRAIGMIPRIFWKKRI